MKRQIITFLAIASITISAIARQPARGYRGFIDWSNSYRTTAVWGPSDRLPTFYTGFSTSHGYQLNPMIYIGAGLDYEYCSKISSNILSLFAEGRADMQFDRYTPFGDIRLGYNFASGGGIYFSPSIGYRFNWGRKAGINLGLGLTLQGYSADVYEIINNPNGYVISTKIGTHHGAVAFFSFRLGIDF